MKNFRLSEIGDSDEDIMPAFDENHESWVTMKEEIVLCLYGITNNLALVCVVREDALNQRGKINQYLALPMTVFSSGIMMYNLNLFRQTIRKTLEQSRTWFRGRPRIEVINHVPQIRQCPPVRGQWKKLASLSVKSVLDYVNSFILQILHEHLNKLNARWSRRQLLFYVSFDFKKSALFSAHFPTLKIFHWKSFVLFFISFFNDALR